VACRALAPARTARPAVHLNLAITEDGAVTGLISSRGDLTRVHRLRDAYDGVAVGARTFEVDRPRLSVRAEHLGASPRRQPLRVVFAGGSRIHDHVLDGADLIAVGSRPPRAADHWVRVGPRDLVGGLEALGAIGLRTLLLEGGPTLWTAARRADVVDLLTAYVPGDSGVAAMDVVRDALALCPTTPLGIRPFAGGHLLTVVFNPEGARALT